METVNNPLLIQQTKDINIDRNYFDIQLFLDIDRNLIRHQKEYGLPVNLECFLPWEYDVLSRAEQEQIILKDYFELDKIEKVDDKDREDLMRNIILLGEAFDVSNYYIVEKYMKDVDAKSLNIPDKKLPKRHDKDDFHISPMKLLLTVLNFYQVAVDDVDEKEEFDLVIDKIALSALLPTIAHPEFWSTPNPIIPNSTEEEDAIDYDQVLDSLVQRLKERDPLRLPHTSLLDSKYFIKIERSFMHDVFAYTLNLDDEHYKPIFPLDSLDELLTDHLGRLFRQLKAEFNSPKSGFGRFLDFFRKNNLQNTGVKSLNYKVFYPVIDKFLIEEGYRSGFKLLKQKFEETETGEELPFIEEIDMKILVWAREAMLITTEMNVAAKMYTLTKQAFESIIKIDEGDERFKLQSKNLIEATLRWHQAINRFEHLKNQASRKGINVTLQPHRSADGKTVDSFFTLTNTQMNSRNVKIQRRELLKWTEKIPIMRCRSRAFRRNKCWWEFITKEHSRWRTWYETVIERYPVEIKIDMDYDPIGTYLELDLNVGAISGDPLDKGIENKAKALARSLGLPANITVPGNSNRQGRSVVKGIKNKHKEVHIFEFADGQYLDQNGIPLNVLLRQIENYQKNPIKEENIIPPSSKKLFLIPQIKIAMSGEQVIEGYFAVHNPLAGRKINVAPNIHLVETYKHSLDQISGHWLGKLSHTSTLFPGEKRKLKMFTSRSTQALASRSQQQNQAETNLTQTNVKEAIRNELENENQSTRKSNWAAGASGGAKFGFGSVKASASGGGESSKSNRNLAKSLNDRVTEVLNQVSSVNEVQFTLSSTESVSRDDVSETEIEIQNVNQGKSITYKFFQIMNQYKSTISLDQIRFVVEYAQEVIPGMDILQTESFELGNLEDLLPELIEEERESLITSIREFVKNRYGKEKLIFTKDIPVGIKDNWVISETTTFVNSGAYFLENEISQLNATEEYIDNLRDSELAKFKAETEKIIAEATAIQEGKFLIPNKVEQVNIYGWGMNNENGKPVSPETSLDEPS